MVRIGMNVMAVAGMVVLRPAARGEDFCRPGPVIYYRYYSPCYNPPPPVYRYYPSPVIRPEEELRVTAPELRSPKPTYSVAPSKLGPTYGPSTAHAGGIDWKLDQNNVWQPSSRANAGFYSPENANSHSYIYQPSNAAEYRWSMGRFNPRNR